MRAGSPRSNLQTRHVCSGLSGSGAKPRDQTLHELGAFFDLRALDPLIRLMRLLDRARPANDRRYAGALKQTRLRCIGNGAS